MKKYGFYIESLNASRVVEKLAQAGVVVLGAKKTQKNAVTVWVDGKDRKKVFAILPKACYNIKEVRPYGFERAWEWCKKSAGVLVGAALFLCAVCFMQTRILKIDVVGSGAYYSEQVLEILESGGARKFSALPAEDSAISAQILSLPRVSFCSLKMQGGVLTVTVEVSDENALIEGKPLLSPADGVVEELVVLRGTPLVAVGDTVAKDAPVVDSAVAVGEKDSRSVIVIARVRISFPVQAEYALSEEAARAQAFLDYGELTDFTCAPSQGGWLVSGTAHAEAAVNLE